MCGAGDYAPSTFCISYSKWRNKVEKVRCSKKSMRKSVVEQLKKSSHSQSILHWFYEFFKEIFHIHSQIDVSTSSEGPADLVKDDEVDCSITSCTQCQMNEVEPKIDQNIRSVMKSNEFHLHLNQLEPKLTVDSAQSKSTQTQLDSPVVSSNVHPLYCFSMKEGRLLPIVVSSLPSDMQRASSCHPYHRALSHSPSSVSAAKSSPSIHCLSVVPSDPPEVIFAESTCQLIKQAWSSTASNHTTTTEH